MITECEILIMGYKQIVGRYRQLSRLLCFLLLCGIVFMPQSGFAVLRYVAPSGNNGNIPYTGWSAPARTIDAALSISTSGDVIFVSNGTYAIESTLLMTNAVTLRSKNGPDTTIINAGSIRRAFWIGNVSGATVTGFTITNGYHDTMGGAIYLYSGNNLISNCVIKGNSTGASGKGGGIYIQGNSEIQDSLISENYAGYDGGGIYCSNTGARILGSTISSNRVGWDGAGLYLNRGGVVSNCAIIKNYAGTNAYGGGITIRVSGSVFDSTIANNFAGYDGGGVYCWDGGMIRDCIVRDNDVDGDGAGVYMKGLGSATNCTIRNNTCSGFYTAFGRGGGLVLNGGGNAFGCTIQDNTATDVGGGVFINNCGGGIVSGNDSGTVHNCAMLANHAIKGGGVWSEGGGVWDCTIIDNSADGFATSAGGLYTTNETVVANNIIYYNTADTYPNIRMDNSTWALYYSCTPHPPTNTAGVGNITNSPGLLDFPYSAHEYHLAPSSPCINFGTNYAWMTVDIDGQPRIQQAIVDMGADEYATNPPGFNAEAGSNLTIGEGTLVSFDASGSTAGGGAPLQYRWYFGDGSTPTDWLSTPTTAYTYGSAGIYTSKLIVLNNISLDMDTRVITVTNVPPTVDAGGPYTTYVNDPLTIMVSGSATGDYDVLKYRYDFNGQGWSPWTTSTSSNWTYTATGQTNVYVQCGKFMDFMDPAPASTGSTFAVVTITNIPPEITHLGIDPDENWLDQALQISVTAIDPGTNDVLQYSYNWEGAWSVWGLSSNAIHTYTNGGAQTVQVLVCDEVSTGEMAQVHINVIVSDAQSITRSNGQPNISWQVVSNHTYIVQEATDMQAGLWSNVTTVITTSVNTLDFLATNNQSHAIFRTILTP